MEKKNERKRREDPFQERGEKRNLHQVFQKWDVALAPFLFLSCSQVFSPLFAFLTPPREEFLCFVRNVLRSPPPGAKKVVVVVQMSLGRLCRADFRYTRGAPPAGMPPVQSCMPKDPPMAGGRRDRPAVVRTVVGRRRLERRTCISR